MHVLIQATTQAAAAAATQPGTTTTVNVAWSVAGVVAAVVAAVGGFLVKMLNAHAAAARAAAEANAADARKTLVAQVDQFVTTEAANIARNKMGEVAQLVVSGQLSTPADVKNVLSSWGAELKEKVQTAFSQQGVDVAATLGTQVMDSLISSAAAKTSPVVGMPSSVALAIPDVAKHVIDYGLAATQAAAITKTI
jgi:hypothetical protein